MAHFTDRRKTRKSILLTFLVICGLSVSMVLAGTAGSDNAPGQGQEGKHRVNIRISIGSTIMVATLEDNPTARRFSLYVLVDEL